MDNEQGVTPESLPGTETVQDVSGQSDSSSDAGNAGDSGESTDVTPAETDNASGEQSAELDFERIAKDNSSAPWSKDKRFTEFLTAHKSLKSKMSEMEKREAEWQQRQADARRQQDELTRAHNAMLRLQAERQLQEMQEKQQQQSDPLARLTESQRAFAQMPDPIRSPELHAQYIASVGAALKTNPAKAIVDLLAPEMHSFEEAMTQKMHSIVKQYDQSTKQTVQSQKNKEWLTAHDAELRSFNEAEGSLLLKMVEKGFEPDEALQIAAQMKAQRESVGTVQQLQTAAQQGDARREAAKAKAAVGPSRAGKTANDDEMARLVAEKADFAKMAAAARRRP